MPKRLPPRIVSTTLALFIFSQLFLAVTLGTASEIHFPLRSETVNAAPDSDVSAVQGFHLVSSDEGWLLLNQQLYWTTTGGQTWKVITPPNLWPSIIRSVFFLDARRGWIVLTHPTAEYAIARTVDGGDTWQTRPLALFSSGEIDALAAAVYLHWLDAQTGWLVVRRATSSNFSIGALFKTTDGGDSWERLTIPIGEPVYFATDALGWTAGGAAGNQLFVTRDGGRTWNPQTIGGRGDSRIAPTLPRFENARDGVLPVVVSTGNESRLELYRTHNGGESWNMGSRLPLGREIAPGTRPPIAILDAERSAIVLPRDQVTEDIQEIDMATPHVGWAKYAAGNCTSNRDKTSISCSQTTRLLRTSDGGETWQPLALPGSAPDTVTITQSSNQPLAATSAFTYTQTVVGQGFDACGLPSTNQFQTWWRFSPYMAYNLYIGGAAMASCTPLSAPLISELASQGWKFFPTWVGPQAPCYAPAINVARMSFDPTTAYNQGVAEANSALNTAANLGLTDATKSGTIIYYDLEAYAPASQACRDAVNSFISGWSGQLQSRNNLAGVYGASCGSYVSDWANISHIPDILWIAWWSYSQYNSNATVWGALCLDNTLWVNHQRLRQYACCHNETWGSVTLNIDNDVLDGTVVSLSNVIKPLYRYYFPFVGK